MPNVLFASEPSPRDEIPIASELARLMTRAATLGLLSGADITAIDPASVKRLIKALQRQGIGAEAGVALAPLLVESPAALDAGEQRRLAAALARLAEALESSAVPAAEWPAMRKVFGDDTLGALLGVSPASLRRYAGGERTTPDAVATRLHWLALVVADLAGAYNDFGIRRWFERPRSQLGGRSPRQLLGREWSVDAEPARRVRELAAVLTGAQPLAV